MAEQAGYAGTVLLIVQGILGRFHGMAQAAVINGPFQVLITGVSFSYPKIERVLVPRRKRLP